uniref:neuraminidase-like domain-containing protein n=1 Tax=Serratia proteamaculans TaxID=28151 RepID=UPI001F4C0F98|nr:neuraminidase-like domain-containing protein [Serratia proteamaculans]ULG18934.1 SppA [Serratia proteamaculans]
MYHIDDILEKVNAPRARLSEENDTAVTLTDFFSRSLPEIKKITGDSLSWGEVRYLYRQAQKEQKENRLTESRILARANPQLANTVRLGIRQAASSRSYDDWFGSRADRFARPNSVASMFSPAAYLTELYREAKDLHPATSQYRLDTRRPDLAQLALSQNNMDEEITTLGLSSELLLRSVGSHENLDDGAVMELLTGYRQTGMTPYHRVYEAARQAILLRDPMLQAFDRNPDVAQLMDRASLLAIESDISPVLYQILTEEITANNYAALWTKNFGDTEVSMFASPDYLARYYGIDNDTLASLLSMVSQPAGSDTGGTVILTEVDKPRNLACQVTALGDDSYRLRLTILQNITDLGFGILVRGVSPNASYWEDRTLSYVKDVEFSVDVTVPDADFTDNRRILNLFQGTSATGGSGISRFTITRIITTSHQEFYLKLNKVLRLYKACGITPAELLQITSSLGDALTIDHAVLSKIFQVRYLMSHYQLDVARSLVLCNGTISDQAFSGENGLFNTLFNTPPLNGQQFSADDTALDLRSEAPEDAFRLNVLKRAFNVSASGLSTLWQLARGNSSAGFTCSADNIAALYRVKLLADIHDLSVGELSMLLSVSPFSGVATGSLSDDELTQLIQFLYQTTTWLTAQGWSVSDVFLMLTTTYSTLLTPEMENLFATLRSGLSGRSFSSSDELSTTAAPLVAASTQLDSSDSAGAMLDWADALQPEGLTLADFISLVMTDAQHDEEQTARLAGFCQVLWQLSLIIRHTGLSTRELTLVVSQPGRFHAGLASLPHDLQTLRDLTRFHDTVNRCGSYAADVLTALAAGELPVTLLATAQKQDEQDVAGALTQVRGDNGQDSGVFTTWKEVDQAEQWLDMSAVLSVTPSGLARLITLKYISVSDDSAPSYSEWLAVSGLLQSGLDSSQTATLSAALEESTSSALCAYYLRNLAPVMVSSRDDLFGYLLLDNQVSAQVKTTRLAEAIASIQLYVNRTLNGMENSPLAEVRTRQFFTDWDMYNKRYSTWAGVSELVYYPENYIDPTVRIGQTSMMDTLLQSVGQSSINRDTVEDAYRTYLTSFEQIANLRIISGYHDHVDNDQGLTYIIGCNDAEEATWYWRCVDHNKMKEGVIPANAWTEWLPIHCGLNPFNNVVRPVVFNNYLYIAWLERKETAKTSADGSINPLYGYTLNLSRRRYDDTWSSPVSFDLSATAIETVLNLTTSSGSNVIGNQGLELSLSRDNESNVLHGIFYCFWDSSFAGPSSQSDSYFIHIDEFLAITEVTDQSEQERVYKNTVNNYGSISQSRIIDRVFVDRLSFSYTTKIDPSAVYDLSTHRIVDFSGTKIQKSYVKSNNAKTITVGVESFVSCTLNEQTYTNTAVVNLFKNYFSASDFVYIATVPASNISDVSFACMINATTKKIVGVFYNDSEETPYTISVISNRIIIGDLATFIGGTSITYFEKTLTEAQINSAINGLVTFNITAIINHVVNGSQQRPTFKEYTESYLYPVSSSQPSGGYLLSYGSLVINSAGTADFTPVGSRLSLSLGKNTLTPDTMVLETDISSEEVNICVAVSHKNAPETYLAMRYMAVSILYTGSVATKGSQYISLLKNFRGHSI